MDSLLLFSVSYNYSPIGGLLIDGISTNKSARLFRYDVTSLSILIALENFVVLIPVARRGK